MQLAYAPIRTMEPAIVSRLRLAFPAKTFTIERVPQTMTLKEFERLAKLSPFIGLAWTGMKADPDSGRSLKGKMLWRLILIFQASNSLETRFKGDARGLGLDAMIDVSVALLQGAVFDKIGVCNVTLANSVIADGFTDDQVVIAQVDFEINFTTSPANFDILSAEAFERLGITWAVSNDPNAMTISDEIALPQE
ncbi:hypothetical protein [Rhizobium sp.]|uniref:hypothetical protein n=1 Tax=Rhizobium sp. TaxID=391 RepID=UPI003F7D1392